MTPPTSAPSCPAPTKTANSRSCARDDRGARARPAATPQQRAERDEQQHRERRLQLVAQAVEASAGARVGPQQRADDERRSEREIDRVGADRQRGRHERRARPCHEAVGQRCQREGAGDDDRDLRQPSRREPAGEQQHRQHPHDGEAADPHAGEHAAPVGDDPEREHERQPREHERAERRHAAAADDAQARLDGRQRGGVARAVDADALAADGGRHLGAEVAQHRERNVDARDDALQMGRGRRQRTRLAEARDADRQQLRRPTARRRLDDDEQLTGAPAAQQPVQGTVALARRRQAHRDEAPVAQQQPYARGERGGRAERDRGDVALAIGRHDRLDVRPARDAAVAGAAGRLRREHAGIDLRERRGGAPRGLRPAEDEPAGAGADDELEPRLLRRRVDRARRARPRRDVEHHLLRRERPLRRAHEPEGQLAPGCEPVEDRRRVVVATGRQERDDRPRLAGGGARRGRRRGRREERQRERRQRRGGGARQARGESEARHRPLYPVCPCRRVISSSTPS